MTTNFSGVVVGEAAKPAPAIAHSLDDPEAFDGLDEQLQMEEDFRRSEAEAPPTLPAVDNMILHPTMEQTLAGRSSEDQQALLKFVAERRSEALARRHAVTGSAVSTQFLRKDIEILRNRQLDAPEEARRTGRLKISRKTLASDPDSLSPGRSSV